jgi:hypothetical protein
MVQEELLASGEDIDRRAEVSDVEVIEDRRQVTRHYDE